jgi:hypothetical protein
MTFAADRLGPLDVGVARTAFGAGGSVLSNPFLARVRSLQLNAQALPGGFAVLLPLANQAMAGRLAGALMRGGCHLVLAGARRG